MLSRNIITLYAEAANYANGESYISDISLSSMWGEDADFSRTEEIATVLWSIYSGGIRYLIERSGMSARQFALSFGIPIRTMENWCSGERTPTNYLLLLLAESLGVL